MIGPSFCSLFSVQLHDAFLVVCFPSDSGKRKADECSADDLPAKAACVSLDPGDCDLIVLGLAWKTTTQALQAYFGQYGSLRICQVCVQEANLRHGEICGSHFGYCCCCSVLPFFSVGGGGWREGVHWRFVLKQAWWFVLKQTCALS